LVAVRLSEGDAITGRIVSSSEDGVQLDVDGDTREIRFGDVDRALVQVELNRPRAARSEDEEG
jgi:ribosome maturation factor RimP